MPFMLSFNFTFGYFKYIKTATFIIDAIIPQYLKRNLYTLPKKS